MTNLLGFKVLESGGDQPQVTIESISRKEIAIIGMAVQFPQADSPDRFWENLVRGVDSIRPLPLARRRDTDPFLFHRGLQPPEISYINGGFLGAVDRFDYRFFGLSYADASLMDPCQRLFLQTAWQALEDAGYGGSRLVSSKTGVYLGFSNDFDTETTYKRYIAEMQPESSALAVTGNIRAIIASRISYLLDLKGPAMLIDTTCSSSLVAVHQACQAIRGGECDFALAGGVELHLLPLQAEERERMGIEAADHRTKSFDERSDGSGSGEGVAAVLLRPLDQALRDGDFIYAVIKGSAINQDGASMSLTAPSAAAQEQVLVQAWKEAGIDPTTLSYIEAHGSGTKLGDPIEAEGLMKAFARFTGRRQFCGIGSVKTNLGHLGNCAGIAGMIKSTLSLHHRQLPATLHFRRPSRKIDFKRSPLYVVDETQPWEAEAGTARRCGVSSFGLSGTNCHVVLEEAPQGIAPAADREGELHLLALSARSQEALQRLVQAYRERLAGPERLTATSLCRTAGIGRGHYGHRLAIVFSNLGELREKLTALHGLDSQEPGLFYGEHKPGAAEVSRYTEAAEALLSEGQELRTSGLRLSKLAQLYVSGATVRWELLYPHGGSGRLPVYPFEPVRCWIDVKDRPALYHEVGWQPAGQVPEAMPLTGTALLLRGASDLVDTLRKQLEQAGVRVIEAWFGTGFAKRGEGVYEIGCRQADYDRLLDELQGLTVEHVVLAGALGAGEPDPGLDELAKLDESQRRGVYSLFNLTKAVLKQKWKQNVRLLLLGHRVADVTGDGSALDPAAATLFGLGKVVSHEYPHLSCRSLDLDEQTTAGQVLAVLGAAELPYLTALRDGQRYSEVLRPFRPEARRGAPITLHRDGVYVITGGTGGMALEVARWLSEQERVSLALVSRTAFPGRSEWERLLAGGASRKLRSSIERLLEVETNGGMVRFYQADVADEGAISRVFADLRQTFGRIHGIIHCAGVAGNGFLVNKPEERFTEVLAPKVRGTAVLDRLTRDDPPDFFLLFSSISTLIAAVGQGDYTAANAYLDAFARARSRSGHRTLSLNWAMWQETGMAVDYGIQNDSVFRELYTTEALLALQELIGTDAMGVVIGELKYGEMLDLLEEKPAFLAPEIRAEIQRQAAHPAAAAVTEAPPPRQVPTTVVLHEQHGAGHSQVEQRLAEIWSQLLKVEQISLHDNFYELGGNSILATHLLRALNEAFPNEFDITDIFSYPTISLMAGYLESSRQGGGPQANFHAGPDGLDDLLDRLSEGDLSVDQVSELYKTVGEQKWKT